MEHEMVTEMISGFKSHWLFGNGQESGNLYTIGFIMLVGSDGIEKCFQVAGCRI